MKKVWNLIIRTRRRAQFPRAEDQCRRLSPTRRYAHNPAPAAENLADR